MKNWALFPIFTVALFGLTAFTSVENNIHDATLIQPGDTLTIDAPRGLNVRKKPNAKKIGAIPHGSTVYAAGPAQLHPTGHAGHQYWLPVRYLNESAEWKTGWIYLRYANRTKTLPVDSSQTQAQVTRNLEEKILGTEFALQQAPIQQETFDAVFKKRGALTLTVSVGTRARFRSQPSFSGQILGSLENNTQLEIIGKPHGDWIPIRVTKTGQVGWIHITLLEASGGLNPLELAFLHENKKNEAQEKIDELIKTHSAEAGLNKTCDSCQGQNQNLEPLPLATSTKKTFISPVSGSISSHFGHRDDPIDRGTRKMHKGLDIRVSQGTPIKAIRAGKVIKVVTGCKVGQQRCGSGYGNHVRIDHGDGFVSIYAHLSNVQIKKGTTVRQGQQIGLSGNTGRSTGPHLHLQLEYINKPVDPLRYIK